MPEIAGIILAGGRATRMGGGDKGLQPLGQGCLLDHVIARLSPQVGRLAINANGDPARLAQFGLPILPDSLPDHPGPLAGVLAGMDWAAGHGASHVLSAAADTPFFPRDLAARLLEAGDFALAAAPDRDGRLWTHPTFGLWPVRLRDDLRSALAGGLRKIVLWTDAQGAEKAVFPPGPPDPFFNVNTPEDLAVAQGMLRDVT